MSDVEWFYAQGETQVGPVTEAELRAAIARGDVTRDSLVWSADLPDWQAASRIAHLWEDYAPPKAPAPEAIGPSPDAPVSGLAIASIITGVLSVFAVGCGLPLAIVALICGWMALKKITHAPGQWRGRGLAVAGLVLGGLALVFDVIFVVVALVNAFGY